VSSEFRIRSFAPDDVSQVASIEAASYRDPWSEESFRDVQKSLDTSWVAVSEDSEEIIGYLVTQWVVDEVHILNVAVRADCRRRGVATNLLAMLLDLASHRGMREAYLEVRVSNHAARNIYRNFGFSDMATRKRYYPDGEDALVMQMNLTNTQSPKHLIAVSRNSGGRHGH
jgi:ribosomal-protein-alanine N-acetyltransferase